MHDIEPYYLWRDDYIASEDEHSPFFETEYSEFYYDKQIYNYLIHPQWDNFGSQTLYIKILFVDYDTHFAIIEFIGEWNDAINNDIMLLKREILESMTSEGVNKFILIGENILNFHASDDCYYEEWYQDIEDGWIAAINFREHVIDEFKSSNLDCYINFGGLFNQLNWRKLKPSELFLLIENQIIKRFN